MAGGEFCGNAARAVSVILSLMQQKANVQFKMSGFNGTIKSSVKKIDDGYNVESIFPKMSIVLNDTPFGPLIDLGGIVHIVTNGKMPKDFTKAHRKIVKKLDLTQREAVGVIWYENILGQLKMNPVVWVKAVDSFYYETSCGSGSIAVSKVTGNVKIYQPTNQPIYVEINDSFVSLRSKMKIIKES